MPRIRILAEQVLIRLGTIGTPPENISKIGAVESSLWNRLLRKPDQVCSFRWSKHGDWINIVSSQENAIASRWIIIERENSTKMLILDRQGNAMLFEATGPDDSLESPSEDSYIPATEREVEATIAFLKFLLSKDYSPPQDSY